MERVCPTTDAAGATDGSRRVRSLAADNMVVEFEVNELLLLLFYCVLEKRVRI